MARGSDASVLVVSEETGVVSIAYSGELIRNVTESQMRNHLTGVMIDGGVIRERFRKFSGKEQTQNEKA